MENNSDSFDVARRRLQNSSIKNSNNNKRKDSQFTKSKQQYKKIGGMTGKIKVFDQGLYEKYDKKSRVIIKQKLGSAVKDNPDKYGEDMIVDSNRIPHRYIELQVYGRWVNDEFPYESPFIYERKMRFNKSTLFICFNASYSKLIMFSRDSVHPKKYRVKKYAREFIHYVPWSKALTLDTDKLDLEIIRNYCGIYDDDEECDKESDKESGQTDDRKVDNSLIDTSIIKPFHTNLKDNKSESLVDDSLSVESCSD
ncbi:hypothetical protein YASMINEVIRUS_972 [Yasminevirus sp. GU-2018]|uniref:Uncharacterized protein n=1 Tax=Yasminevirus sp. GU-2018 TaxID=2420051 RepID=A0A5K0U8N3_9VIRU|nr:hypothetical protein YASMINEVIRUS_972 [Yasminevirus sp. GU-2018]